MTGTTERHPAPTPLPSTGSVWRTGIAAGVVAAAAVVLFAAVARALDVPVAAPQPGSDTAEAVPLAAFAIFTAVGTLVGTGLASVLARRLARPAGPFVIVTVALTVLSLALPATADTDTASQVVLGLTHLVAAAVVIPALAMRLRR